MNERVYGSCFAVTMKLNEEQGEWRQCDLELLTGLSTSTFTQLEKKLVMETRLFVSEEVYGSQLEKLVKKYAD